MAILFTVYRAGDDPIVCYRATTNNPAQPGDFVPYAEMRGAYRWPDEIYAIGVSTFDTARAAVAATRARYPYVAKLDLATGNPDVKWARTRSHGHVTLWAPPSVLLDCVVEITER